VDDVRPEAPDRVAELTRGVGVRRVGQWEVRNAFQGLRGRVERASKPSCDAAAISVIWIDLPNDVNLSSIRSISNRSYCG
jgi:hypothetical protein